MGGGYGAGRFRHGSSPVMYVGRASVKCGIKTQKSGCATRHMAKSPENQEPGYLDGAERWPNFLTCRVSCHFLPLDGLGRPDYSDVLPCHPVDVLIYMLSCHRAFAYPYAQSLQEARRAFAAGGARAFGPGAGVRRSFVHLVGWLGCLRGVDKTAAFSTDWLFSGSSLDRTATFLTGLAGRPEVCIREPQVDGLSLPDLGVWGDGIGRESRNSVHGLPSNPRNGRENRGLVHGPPRYAHAAPGGCHASRGRTLIASLRVRVCLTRLPCAFTRPSSRARRRGGRRCGPTPGSRRCCRR